MRLPPFLPTCTAGVAAEAVVHFLGGAFVGAAPQLAYRLFLESLASRGVLVGAGPGFVGVGDWGLHAPTGGW